MGVASAIRELAEGAGEGCINVGSAVARGEVVMISCAVKSAAQITTHAYLIREIESPVFYPVTSIPADV